jgi:hypothetical protein
VHCTLFKIVPVGAASEENGMHNGRWLLRQNIAPIIDWCEVFKTHQPGSNYRSGIQHPYYHQKLSSTVRIAVNTTWQYESWRRNMDSNLLWQPDHSYTS